MAAVRSDDLRETGFHIGGAIRRHWGLFLAEGIVLVILGILALLAPQIASVAATVFFGWLLLISGIIGLFTTFRARQAPGFWWSLISAVIGIVAGVLLIGFPSTALWAIGLLLGINLIFGGWALIFMALHARPTNTAAPA
jgi:uncharacterized membrane protein HdeD (DUF308 family)